MMDRKEVAMLIKAEKQRYSASIHEFERQSLINCFLINRLPESEIKELEREVLKFDEDNKPENLKKREEDLKKSILRFAKNSKGLPQDPKEEV